MKLAAVACLALVGLCVVKAQRAIVVPAGAVLRLETSLPGSFILPAGMGEPYMAGASLSPWSVDHGEISIAGGELIYTAPADVPYDGFEVLGYRNSATGISFLIPILLVEEVGDVEGDVESLVPPLMGHEAEIKVRSLTQGETALRVLQRVRKPRPQFANARLPSHVAVLP